MRLILKTVAGHFQTYWIAVEKKSIIGWFSGDWLRHELKISNDFHFEAHFTFPQDGNFHNSYKYINKDHEEFINVYWDKVKIKSIIKGEKILSEKTRQEFSNNILGHIVPQYKADTLDLVKQFFERNDVPMECIPEALQNVSKVMHDNDLDQWPVQDVCVL